MAQKKAKTDNKFKPGTVGECIPKNLWPAPWNPFIRSDHTKGSMRDLIENIAEEGQYRRILINPDGMIIDGHRRSIAAAFLVLPVRYEVLEAGKDPRKAYRSINKYVRPLQGKEALQVWLMEPLAVDPKSAAKFSLMEKRIGRKNFRAWGMQERLSMMTFDVAERSWSYLRYYRSRYNMTFLQIVTWLVEQKQSWAAKNALEQGIPAKRLADIIREEGRIRFSQTIL